MSGMSSCPYQGDASCVVEMQEERCRLEGSPRSGKQPWEAGGGSGKGEGTSCQGTLWGPVEALTKWGQDEGRVAAHFPFNLYKEPFSSQQRRPEVGALAGVSATAVGAEGATPQTGAEDPTPGPRLLAWHRAP